MIFACDLDQTLIYSRNSMGLIDVDIELVPVETYNEQYHSFMTQTAYHKLQRISQQIHFVPTTTRIYEQFERVFGIRESIQSGYAIVSNGGKVFVDGHLDRNWDSQVRQATKQRCAPSEEVKQIFDKLVDGVSVIKESYSDELFYSIIVERAMLPDGLMNELETRIQPLGWSCSLQGRKIYLVPNTVSKGLAAQYVKELAGAKSLFAAGDSLLDESMLVIADVALAPKHGELYRKYGAHSKIRFTEHSGIRACEEILDALLEQMEVRNAQ